MKGEESNAIFVCKFCSQPAPHEWGASRRCSEYPQEQRDRPGYMQSCEFEAIPLLRPVRADDEPC